MEARMVRMDCHSSNVLATSRWNQPRIVPTRHGVLVKQLFAGQVGLTLTAANAGYQFGFPLDMVATGWGAATRAGRRNIDPQLENEDPYCVSLTPPCGPWGSWSWVNVRRGGSSAQAVLRRREAERRLLMSVDRAVHDRIGRGRHIILETLLGQIILCNLR